MWKLEAPAIPCGLVRLGFLFVLLLIVGGTASGCATGLYGSAAGGADPVPATPTVATQGTSHQFGGPDNLIPNGSFTDGTTTPWLPSVQTPSEIYATAWPSRVGTYSLLVWPRGIASYATKAIVANGPKKGARYSFGAWVQGSPNLVGTPITLQLVAVRKNGDWVLAGAKSGSLGRTWRHFSVRATVPIWGARDVTAVVVVPGRSPRGSWFAVDGVAAKVLSRAR
jgi:hypothetical protein